MLHLIIRRSLHPLIAAWVVFLLAAVAAVSLIWHLERHDIQEQRALASNQVIDHAQALQREIERALSATYALEALLRQGNGSISNFDAVASQMLPLYPGVSSVSLAPAGIIRRVVPLTGNAPAVGLDLLRNPATKKEASFARDTGKLTLTGPFKLENGKLAAVGRLPIFLDDARARPFFWGFINVTIDFPEALAVADLPQLAAQGFAYELWRIHPDSGQKLIISASSSAALKDPLERTLEVPNATWTLGLVPVNGWRDLLGLWQRTALGLLFSLLLAFVAKLMVDLSARQQGLEAPVVERTSEVLAREADLNLAQSIARVGSWWLDLTERKLNLSPEASRIFGMTGETPPNHAALLRHVHPEDRDAVDRAWQAATRKGERYDIEYRLLIGASIRWVHEQADLEITADGKQRRCVGTVQDITERRRAEETVRASEERLRLHVERTRLGAIEWDKDFRVVSWNPAAERIFGYTAVEALGRHASFILPDSAKASVDQVWRGLLSGLGGERSTNENIAKNGRTIICDWYNTRLTRSGDNMIGVASLIEDITERKRAEESLRESEEELRAIFEGVLDGIVVVDTATRRFLDMNAALCRMLGYTHEEIVRLGVSNIHPKQDLARVIEQFERQLRGEIQMAEEIPVMRKDGSIFKTDIKSAPIRFGGKDCMLGLFRDNTERNQAERELVESEARFRGLVEQSISGIYIIQDGILAYVNPRFAEIRGYSSADEVTGLDPMQLIAERDRGTVAEINRRLFAGEMSSINHSFIALRKDGSNVDVGVHSTYATYRGRPAIIGLLQDISEKKRAEEKINHYIAQLEIAFMQTVEVATVLSEMRDPYTTGHERRVAEIAVAIGAELGFDARRQEGLRVAGYLHDIGKITIPTEILSKPGKLSAVEFQLIQGHAQASYDVLKGVEFPWPVAQIALQHHERVDGSGYPQGLKGEAILLDARIMAVADVVEAMSSHRPYRPGLGIDKALAEIERGRTTMYDPVVADACLRLFRETGFVLPA